MCGSSGREVDVRSATGRVRQCSGLRARLLELVTRGTEVVRDHSSGHVGAAATTVGANEGPARRSAHNAGTALTQPVVAMIECRSAG